MGRVCNTTSCLKAKKKYCNIIHFYNFQEFIFLTSNLTSVPLALKKGSLYMYSTNDKSQKRVLCKKPR